MMGPILDMSTAVRSYLLHSFSVGALFTSHLKLLIQTFVPELKRQILTFIHSMLFFRIHRILGTTAVDAMRLLKSTANPVEEECNK
jgi:hypothetical protein